MAGPGSAVTEPLELSNNRCVDVYTHENMCGGQRSTLGVVLNPSPLHLLGHSLSLIPELTDSANLPSLIALRIPCLWFPNTEITDGLPCIPGFLCGSWGIQTQVLAFLLFRQAFYPLWAHRPLHSHSKSAEGRKPPWLSPLLPRLQASPCNLLSVKTVRIP